ncbi:outer membrane beta-barrel protein [Flavobacterium fluviatile]|uniref:outer membrane beta-barrel protein n=1 Tax=Flavobacterium fluviatile TaxID=1862387 RepID=UPI0013D36680|nr:outer membrane beta-barrel protein [Flavobacterium fluviatile]
MKTRIIATVVALFVITFLQAQQQEAEAEIKSAKGVSFQPGSMFIEGGISFSTNDDNNSYSINPKFGYFLTNKFAVGGDLDFGGSEVKATDAKTNFFGIGAFARYYFFEADSKRFKAYGDVGLGYSHSREEGNVVGGGSYDETTNGIKANISLGLNYFFSQSFAATFVLADILTYNNAKPENGSASDSFELNINLFNNIFAQPKFGLLYKF